MNLQKEFQTILLPVIKGLPITAMLILIAVLLTTRSIHYIQTAYQANGSMRIDNRNANIWNNVLFHEQSGGSSAGASGDIMTEIEIFKSKKLIQKALQKLDFGTTYFRIGKIKNTELYQDNPFSVAHQEGEMDIKSRLYFLQYIGENQFLFSTEKDKFELADTLTADHPFEIDDLEVTLNIHSKKLRSSSASLAIGDQFAFQFNSLISLAKSINDENYFVRPIDKDVQILKIYFQHEIAEKAALMVDAIMESYIQLCVEKQDKDADQRLHFLDEQLESVKSKLKDSEVKLADYKARKGIINLEQKTDATLKELMQLDIQNVQYDLQKAELERLYDFLSTGNNLQEFAPNFESLREPVFKDTYLKVQNMELQKSDYLLKYTMQSEEIQNIDAKANKLRTFLHESVKNALGNIEIRQTQLKKAIRKVSKKIQRFPSKERKIVGLEREVKLNEQLYNYMVEKHMELAIAKSSNTIHHQIIDRAIMPTNPIWPNKSLIYGVALFLAISLGLLLSFIKHSFRATISNKQELPGVFGFPIIGTVEQLNNKTGYSSEILASLYTNLEILKNKNIQSSDASLIVVSSMLPFEGKTFTASHLAEVLASMGKRVLIVDMAINNPQLHRAFQLDNSGGLAAIIQHQITPNRAILSTTIPRLSAIPAGQTKAIFPAILFAPQSLDFIQTLRPQFDYIIVDTPPIDQVIDSMSLMHQSDFNLFVVKARQSKIRTIKRARQFLEEYQVPNVYAVLNNVKGNSKTSSFLQPSKSTLPNFNLIPSTK